MTTTYTDGLLRFAETNSLIDLQHLKDGIDTFVRSGLGAIFYEFNIPHMGLNNTPGLMPIWTNHEVSEWAPVRTGDTYTGFVMYCYDNDKELWVTTRDRAPLRRENRAEYEDHWNRAHEDDKLPQFWPYDKHDILTSVSVPLHDTQNPVRQGSNRAKPQGFMCLEFGTWLRCTDPMKENIAKLAHAVGMLFRTHNENNQKKRWQEKEIAKLRNLAGLPVSLVNPSRKVPLIHVLPGLPGADRDPVVKAITGALKDCAGLECEVIQPLGRPDQRAAFRSLVASQYGVCYLPPNAIPDGAGDFRPNAFRGLSDLHAFLRTDLSRSRQWILIGEGDLQRYESVFGDHTVRTVVLDPDAVGEVDLKKLVDELERAIEGWS